MKEKLYFKVQQVYTGLAKGLGEAGQEAMAAARFTPPRRQYYTTPRGASVSPSLMPVSKHLHLTADKEYIKYYDNKNPKWKEF